MRRNPIDIPPNSSVEIDKWVPKFTWRSKGLKRTKQFLKRTKLQDFHHMVSKLTRPDGRGIKTDL